VPHGIWDIFHTREDCCRINYPYSSVCNPYTENEIEVTDPPTPYPTLSTPEVSDEEKFFIELRGSGLPFTVSISELREDMHRAIKRTLLLLAERYPNLKILSVELRNGRIVSSVSDSTNQNENTPERSIRRQVKMGYQVTGDPSSQERVLQRNPFDIVFDVTVLRREGLEWGPIIVEYIKDNGEKIVNDIFESARIRGFEVGESSLFKVCIMTSTSDAFVECTRIEEASPRTAEPAPTPEQYTLPKPVTITPTSEPMETPDIYYQSRPTTLTFNLPDLSKNPTVKSHGGSIFVPFESEYDDAGSIGLLWWEIILLILASLIISCFSCLLIGWFYRSQCRARQAHINIIEKESNGSTTSPKSNWSDDDSQSQTERPYEQYARNERIIAPLTTPPTLYQLADSSQQKLDLQLGKASASNRNKTDFERWFDFVVDDDVSTLPNRSLRDLMVVDESSAEHSKPDPSSYSKKNCRIRRSAMEPLEHSRRSKEGKDWKLYLDNGGAEEITSRERRKYKGIDPSICSIGKKRREAVDPSVSEGRGNNKRSSNRPYFIDDSFSLGCVVDEDCDISILNSDLESVPTDDPSMYSHVPFPTGTGGYWETEPEFYLVSGDSAQSDGGWSKYGADYSVCSTQSFRTISPSDQETQIIDTIQDLVGIRSHHFATSTLSISSRSHVSHQHGNDRSTLTHHEGDDINSDNSALTAPPISSRARDPSYHLSGYHYQSVHVDDFEAPKENGSHRSTENLKASLTALTHSLRDDNIGTTTRSSQETSISHIRESRGSTRMTKKGGTTGSRVSSVSFATTTMEGEGTVQYDYLQTDPVVFC
ncbi:hypothetical protein ACHAXS_006046, partial [Conticribra weissflogii]